MTHCRTTYEPHQYVVNPWPVAIGAICVLAVAIFAASEFVVKVCT